jgi:hypothetical protein
MSVKEIIEDWLKEHGYDGLLDGDCECGCSFDDFMPCGEVYQDCQEAHKHKDGLMYKTPEVSK